MSRDLRVFQPADLPRCREILDSLPDWFGDAASNAGYLSRLSPTTAAVIALDSRVLGFVSLLRHNQKSVEVDVIAVDRKNREAGLGRLMMEWAEATAQAEGARWLHVKTRGPSTPDPEYEQTRGFYAHLGYDPLFESLELWGPQDAALVFVKNLAVPGSAV